MTPNFHLTAAEGPERNSAEGPERISAEGLKKFSAEGLKKFSESSSTKMLPNSPHSPVSMLPVGCSGIGFRVRV